MASACAGVLTLDRQPDPKKCAPGTSLLPNPKASVPAAPLTTSGEGDWKVVGKGKRKASPNTQQSGDVSTPDGSGGDASAPAPRTDHSPSTKIQRVKEVMADLEKQLAQPEPTPRPTPRKSIPRPTPRQSTPPPSPRPTSARPPSPSPSPKTVSPPSSAPPSPTKAKTLPPPPRAHSTSPPKEGHNSGAQGGNSYKKRLCYTGEETEKPLGGCRRKEAEGEALGSVEGGNPPLSLSLSHNKEGAFKLIRGEGSRGLCIHLHRAGWVPTSRPLLCPVDVARCLAPLAQPLFPY
ncbi:unnamed protein product [Acanthosepion pharaonis]|uniref:Uncharacterized protein n=1 Tax=Acanthosepion pharaonis TaxID=158019 RepID=A0A812CSQ6_ACAPH|nr:unnamed protein product [Sepia pharaonis]